MQRLLMAVTATLGVLASLPAAAQFQKPEDAIKYRQGALTVMGSHFGRIAAMAQGKVPFDAKAAAESASIANTLAPLPFAAFGEGTEKGLPNRAKSEIWKEPAKFKTAADAMVMEIGKLEVAAKSGNLDAIKAAVGATGKSCKACHDDYRAEKYSAN